MLWPDPFATRRPAIAARPRCPSTSRRGVRRRRASPRCRVPKNPTGSERFLDGGDELDGVVVSDRRRPAIGRRHGNAGVRVHGQGEEPTPLETGAAEILPERLVGAGYRSTPNCLRNVSRSSACSSSTARMLSINRRVVMSLSPSHRTISAVRGDRDALGHEIFLDHVDQVGALDVLGVAAGDERGRVEVRLALQLHDSRGDLIGVALLFGRVLQELGGDRRGVDAVGHVVVPLVAQHAHQLGGERLVENLDHTLAVGAVVLGQWALFDVRSGVLAQSLDV